MTDLDNNTPGAGGEPSPDGGNAPPVLPLPLNRPLTDEEIQAGNERARARWHDELARLLGEVETSLRRFIVYPSDHAVVANALWIAATHVQPAWHHATRLRFRSPGKECGKTTAQDVTSELCRGSISAVNISVAALARSISELDPPTFHLDEYQSIFGDGAKKEGADVFQGVFNAGFRRGKPYVRWDVRRNAREEIPTFAMLSLAGVGPLPDMVASRCIDVTLRRKLPSERIEYYRLHHNEALNALRDRLRDCVPGLLPEIGERGRPQLPVDGRDADKWEPLVALADLAGGGWPDRARLACKEMCAERDDDHDDLGLRLLRDLCRVFGDHPAYPSRDLVAALHALPESPWTDVRGRALTQNTLAQTLREYGVGPTTIRFDTGVLRGYWRSALVDAWRRYCDGCQS